MNPEVKKPKRRRGVYLLPNLFTTAGLFAGFYSIIAAMGGRFTTAAIAIIVALFLDGIDGRVARLTKTQTEFGAQYDSLADMVSFGLAPALVMYQWSLASMVDLHWQLARFGWIAAFFYAAMAALRLARFNVQSGTVEKRYFIGLASPSAATILASFIWVCDDLGLAGNDNWLWLPSLTLTILTGALMISPILYYSFKDFDIRDRKPFIGMLIVILIFMLVALDPPKVFFGVFLLYGLSGPVQTIIRRYRKNRRLQDN